MPRKFASVPFLVQKFAKLGIIGIEREFRSKEAGVRTHFLVAVGSALFMVISQYGFIDGMKHDAARVAAQVVSGIGFIGAGTIIFQKNMVRGLTTAAGLWVTAAIGLACGGGMYVAATVTALLSVACLEVMHLIFHRIGDKVVNVALSSYDKEELRKAVAHLREMKIEIDSFEFSRFEAKNGLKHKLNLSMKVHRKESFDQLYELFSTFEGITIESMD